MRRKLNETIREWSMLVLVTAVLSLVLYPLTPLRWLATALMAASIWVALVYGLKASRLHRALSDLAQETGVTEHDLDKLTPDHEQLVKDIVAQVDQYRMLKPAFGSSDVALALKVAKGWTEFEAADPPSTAEWLAQEIRSELTPGQVARIYRRLKSGLYSVPPDAEDE